MRPRKYRPVFPRAFILAEAQQKSVWPRIYKTDISETKQLYMSYFTKVAPTHEHHVGVGCIDSRPH